jgi:futalosine hydrolase
MPLRILIVTAAAAEADSIKGITGLAGSPGAIIAGDHEIDILVTGIGAIATAWSMTKWLSSNRRPDLAVNAGIAGSYREELPTGEVVTPVSDCFGDAGIETSGGFITLPEAGLQDPALFPFRNGQLLADNKYSALMSEFLKPVKAVTVNTATGTVTTIEKLVGKFDPDIETMEGAAFFYVCLRENLPFVAVRSISNRVEPRDRNKWNISLALEKLSEKMGEFILKLNR